MDLAPPPDLPDPPGGDERDTKVQGVQSVVASDSDRVEVEKKGDSNWAKVVEDKKKLKRYDVEISNKEGVNTVEIPDEILDNSTLLWDDFVVGKFLDLAPHVAKVHMVLNKIWRYGDSSTKVDVYEVNPTTMRFRVSNPRSKEKVLRRGMWNVAGVPMIVSKWSPKIEEEEQEEEAIPMWVHLEKVPLHMYSWEGLSFITSLVGVPVKLHSETIACTNLDEAKVFVNVDVSKTLPREITFSKDGKQFTVAYYYPWLPERCKYCDKWGHNESVCAKKMKEKKRQKSASPNSKAMEINEEEVEVKERSVEGSCSKQDSEKQEVQNEEENSGSKTRSAVKENAWSLVSPAKMGCTPSTPIPKNIEVEISASKFSVLSIDEAEEGEILVEEKSKVEEATLEIKDTGEVDVSECDLKEDTVLDQQIQEEVKVGSRRGRKVKILDGNPGKRPGRRKN